MRKNIFFKISLLLFFSILFFVSCGALDKVISEQEKTIFELKSEVVPLKFLLSHNDKNNTTVVAYAFYDLDGNMVGNPGVKILPGDKFFVQCKVRKYNSKHFIVFPSAFFTDLIPPEKAYSIIERYQNKTGFPEIFNGTTEKETKKIKKIYSKILKQKKQKEAFLSEASVEFENKKIQYKLVARVKGGIEILVDKELELEESNE